MHCEVSTIAPINQFLHYLNGLGLVLCAAFDEAHSAGSSPRNLSETAGERSRPLVQFFLHHHHARPLLMCNVECFHLETEWTQCSLHALVCLSQIVNAASCVLPRHGQVRTAATKTS